MQKSIPPPSTAAGYTSNFSARVDVEPKTTKHPMVETSEPQVNASSPAIATRAQDTSRDYPQATDVDRDANVSLSDQGEAESAHFIQEMSLQFPEADNPRSSEADTYVNGVFSAIGAIGVTIGRATLGSKKIVIFFLSTYFIVFADAFSAPVPPYNHERMFASVESFSPDKQKRSGFELARHISDIVPTVIILFIVFGCFIYNWHLKLLQTHKISDSQIEMSGNTSEIREHRAMNELAVQIKTDAGVSSNGYPNIARSMLLPLSLSFVEDAIKPVTYQQLKDAIPESSPSLITLVIAELFASTLDIEGKILERLHAALPEEESGSISKEGAAEIGNQMARSVLVDECGEIASLIVASLPNQLRGKVSGHVDAQTIVQDAVLKELEEGGHVTKMAKHALINTASELGRRGASTIIINMAGVFAGAVIKEEATNILIRVIQRELSTPIGNLVSGLVELAVGELKDMTDENYREILRGHFRVHGKSLGEDYQRKIKATAEQNRREVDASPVNLDHLFMVLSVCVMLLKIVLNGIFGILEGG